MVGYSAPQHGRCGRRCPTWNSSRASIFSSFTFSAPWRRESTGAL